MCEQFGINLDLHNLLYIIGLKACINCKPIDIENGGKICGFIKKQKYDQLLYMPILL